MHTQNHKACVINSSNGLGSKSSIILAGNVTRSGDGVEICGDEEESDEASSIIEKSVRSKSPGGGTRRKPRKQPNCWQYKLFCLYLAYFFLGHGLGILGPTLVDIEELYEVDTSTISVVFTSTGLGLLAGSALCGALFDRFNYEFQFFLATLVLGTMVAAAPWMKHVGGYIAMETTNTVAGGYIDTAGQVYILHLCAGHKYQKSIMQGLLSMWSLGNAVVPLVVQPFLSTTSKHSSRVQASNISTTLSANGHSEEKSGNSTKYTAQSESHIPVVNSSIVLRKYNIEYSFNDSNIEMFGSDGVKYAYLLVGSMVCLASLCFAIACCYGPTFCLQSNSNSRKLEESKKQQSGPLYVATCLAILFFWFFFEAWVETCLSDCAMLFAVKGLGWRKSYGVWVASAMWISQLAGLLASVPVASFLSARTMVYSTALGVTIAGIILQFVVLHGTFYWLGVTLSGLALSLGFGAMILWTNTYIVVTGVSASVFMVGAAAGAMLGPFVIGQLFDVYTPFVTIYIVLAGAVMLLIMTLIFECFIRYFPRTKTSQTEDAVIKSEERSALQIA